MGTWDPLAPNNFYFTTEDGLLIGYDARKTDHALFSIKAHGKVATTVSASYGVQGLLATASHDGTVKIWDTMTINHGEPLLLIEKNMKAVKLIIAYLIYREN